MVVHLLPSNHRITFIILLLLWFALFNNCGYAQSWQVWETQFHPDHGREDIQTQKPFNGFVVRFEKTFPKGLEVTLPDGTKYGLKHDMHNPEVIQSEFIRLTAPADHLTLTGMNQSEPITIIFQYVKPFKSNYLSSDSTNYCESPGLIPQSVWREGLPDPLPNKKSTPTRHLIVHHSASPNQDTNSIDLVRSFYILHTQINGWDDIGYNYLIGYDGTLFAGRDTEKVEINQDNVFGAHFCGKNSYTMGVCVIGTFTDERPDERALNTLTHLLTWKAAKDGMDVLDSLPHPDTIQSNLLPVLSGHRDGCSTECPGQMLYDLLPDLRQSIAGHVIACLGLGTKDINYKFKHAIAYPNPASSLLYLDIQANISSEFRIFNALGQTCLQGSFQGNFIDISHLEPGSYRVLIVSNDIIIESHFVKI